MAKITKSDTKAGSVYEDAAELGSEKVYDGWAEAYDRDTALLGFRLPGLAAAFVARHLPKGAGPILDAAAGTGLVGGYLEGLGYGAVHGLDISAGMLRVAEATGAYAAVTQHDLSAPLPFTDGAFAAALIIGALGPGHAPPDSLRELARVVQSGGIVVFNTVAETQAEQGIPALIARLEAAGIWTKIDESPEWDCYNSPDESVATIVYVFRVT